MKKIMIAVLLLPLSLLAQKKKSTEEKISIPVDSSSKLVSYNEVVQVQGASKEDLYIRGREWFANTFVSANHVIQMDDKEAGKIIGKGNSEGFYTILLTPFTYFLNYTVSITVKDGRYRYEISPFTMTTLPGEHSAGGTGPIEAWVNIYNGNKKSGAGIAKKVIPHMHSTAERLANGIKSALSQPPSGIRSKDDF